MRDIVGTKDKHFQSLGRNGTMYTVGLDVYVLNHTVTFTPINSKMEMGRSRIELPVEAIDDLIYILQKVKETESHICYERVWYDQKNLPPTQISKFSLPF